MLKHNKVIAVYVGILDKRYFEKSVKIACLYIYSIFISMMQYSGNGLGVFFNNLVSLLNIHSIAFFKQYCTLYIRFIVT